MVCYDHRKRRVTATSASRALPTPFICQRDESVTASSEILGSKENSSLPLCGVNRLEMCHSADDLIWVLYVETSCMICGTWILFELGKYVSRLRRSKRDSIAATGYRPSYLLGGLPL